MPKKSFRRELARIDATAKQHTAAHIGESRTDVLMKVSQCYADCITRFDDLPMKLGTSTESG